MDYARNLRTDGEAETAESVSRGAQRKDGVVARPNHDVLRAIFLWPEAREPLLKCILGEIDARYGDMVPRHHMDVLRLSGSTRCASIFVILATIIVEPEVSSTVCSMSPDGGRTRRFVERSRELLANLLKTPFARENATEILRDFVAACYATWMDSCEAVEI